MGRPEPAAHSFLLLRFRSVAAWSAPPKFIASGIASLIDSKPDGRINVSFLLRQLTGSGNITLTAAYQTILVNDTSQNASCTCP